MVDFPRDQQYPGTENNTSHGLLAREKSTKSPLSSDLFANRPIACSFLLSFSLIFCILAQWHQESFGEVIVKNSRHLQQESFQLMLWTMISRTVPNDKVNLFLSTRGYFLIFNAQALNFTSLSSSDLAETLVSRPLACVRIQLLCRCTKSPSPRNTKLFLQSAC